MILVNLRNFNSRKIQFFVIFLCKTIFPPLAHRTRLVSTDVEFYCASFDISKKFVASCPPTETPTRTQKIEFSGRNSQGIHSQWVLLRVLKFSIIPYNLYVSLFADFVKRIFNKFVGSKATLTCYCFIRTVKAHYKPSAYCSQDNNLL